MNFLHRLVPMPLANLHPPGAGIRAVLLDLDDTILDTRRSATEAFASTCTLALERCPGLTEERLRPAYQEVVREVDHRLATDGLTFPHMWAFYRHRWTEILTRCGAAAEHGPSLGEHYGECRRRAYRLCPDVPEVLPRLLERYRVVLLTNGPSDLQRDKLALIDLKRWIGEVYVSSEVGFWKPQREVFEHVLERVGCRPEEAVMVGDSLHHDIAGAAALGIRTVWVNRHGQPSPTGVRPDAELVDLRPLPQLLERWSAGP